MKYYIHAYADTARHLPDREGIIEANNDEEAHNKAWQNYPEYKELYVKKVIIEFEKTKKVRIK